MYFLYKIIIFCMVVFGQSCYGKTETVKRELAKQVPGIQYAHLGNFGPVSRLPFYPSLLYLGLTLQQTIGLISFLWANGFLSPFALRLPNGQPFGGNAHFGPHVALGGNVLGPSNPTYDPYYLFLLSNYERFLPYGLGPLGIYGSTGFPKVKPVGTFKYTDKN